MNEKQSWNITLVFLLLIFGFALATALRPPRAFSETENRTLAQRPEWDLKDLLSGRFEEKYEAYLTDQFVLRDGWIGLKTRTDRAMLRQDSNDVYFGHDGYLIEKHTGVFEADLAGRNIGYTADFFADLLASGRFDADHLSVLVIPNAVDVLKDKLPAYAAPYDEQIYLKALEEALPAGIWVDTTTVLYAHAQEPLYYRTDHHWKTGAAFYVWQSWAKDYGLGEKREDQYRVTTVSDHFTGTIAAKVGIDAGSDTIEAYEARGGVAVTMRLDQSQQAVGSLYDPDALETRDQYAYFLGGNHALTRLSTTAGTGRRLLVIKDSYAHCFAPFLTEDFDEVDLLDLRYFTQSVSAYLAEHDYTDVMLLMNAAGFAEDTSLLRLTG